MTKQLLPEVSLADVNFYMEGLVKEDNRVVVITGPEKKAWLKLLSSKC
jgi:zinc protease